MARYKKEHTEQLNAQIEKFFPHISPIKPGMKTSWEGISRMVMLDRYANKDISLKTLENGDLVVAQIKPDSKFPTLGTGFVVSISPKYVTLEIEDEYVAQISPDLNPEGNTVKVAKDTISKPLEIYYEQIANRVGAHLAEDEKDPKKWGKEFADVIASGNLVPAGRVLYGAGSGTNVTYFNCFVMPMPKDSREGISQHRQEAMEIMSRGGGVGTNGSTLRPRNAIAKTVGGKSSGAVSWLNDLASLTDLVQQGGSRRGAQMIMMQNWHPDIIEFIISKMQNPQILTWIAENFENSEIKKIARDKLKLVPLATLQRKIYEDVVANTKDAELLRQAQAILKQGGKYEVDFPEFLSGANISVGITEDFMEAVKKNEDYELRFPDIENMTKQQKEFYDQEWHNIGDVREWEAKGYPVAVHRTVKAKELWDLINFCATYSAEPGVFFIDTANEMTNAKAYGQKVVCTNPCGEQPLAPYSVCNLAAVNLANMIDHKTGVIEWDKLKETVATAVRLQDNIIDKTPYFLEANRIQATGERRIGMGVMGLHDLLIWSGETYGTPSSIKLIDKVFETMARVSYETSAELGSEKGVFGFQKDLDSLMNTGFIKKLPTETREVIKKNGGLRNSHLLTIAPTGSTGTMAGVSTGLEPYFAFKYFRSGRLGKFMEVDQKIVAEWKENTNHPEDAKLPKFFVSAMDITPEAHVDVQTTIQRWIDSSISKTVNAPKGYTVSQVEKIYTRLYNNGAKGGTVYVDGSRDAQVLSISKTDVKTEIEAPILTSATVNKVEAIKERNADVPGNKLDKKLGTEIGDTCPICKEGTVEDLGGCHSCTNCGAQLKCGI